MSGKRLISILLAIETVQVTGCISVRNVDFADAELPAPTDIRGVITVEGEQVDFDFSATAVRGDTIYGFVDHEPYVIALDQVEKLRVSGTDPGLTVVAVVVGVVVGFVVFGLLLSAGGYGPL